MWKLLLVALLSLTVLLGCASKPNHIGEITDFYEVLKSTCTPYSLVLPAPGNQEYTIPLNTGFDDACEKGMVMAYEMNRSGWERFGTNAFNKVTGAAMSMAPYAAIGAVAIEGFKSAGDSTKVGRDYGSTTSNSYNPSTVSPINDSSTSSSVTTNTTTDNSNNSTVDNSMVDNSNNSTTTPDTE